VACQGLLYQKKVQDNGTVTNIMLMMLNAKPALSINCRKPKLKDTTAMLAG